MAEELEPHILKKYEILQKLGKGAYGVVWKAIDKDSRQTIALKKVFDAFQNATDAQRTYREVMFLKELKGHPNIVNLDAIIRAGNHKDLYLVFDFMETDLHAVIRGNILEDIHRRFIMFQILKGLKYMHTGELIHRDLKPSNILLDSDCLAKLADFGLARSVASINQDSGEAVMTEYVATRWYRAPQILMGSSSYTKSVDMWSVGCILGEMYSGKPVFPGNSTINQIEKIVELLGKPNSSDIESMNSVMAKECLNQINQGKKKSFSTAFGSMDKNGLDLLRKLLTFNPKHRYTVEEALEHPYLKDFHDLEEEISYRGAIRIPVDQNTKYSVKEYREMLYSEMCGKSQPIAKKPKESLGNCSNETDKGRSTETDKTRNSFTKYENEKGRSSFTKGSSKNRDYTENSHKPHDKLTDITNEYSYCQAPPSQASYCQAPPNQASYSQVSCSQAPSSQAHSSGYGAKNAQNSSKAKTQANEEEENYRYKGSQPSSKNYDKIEELRKWYSRQDYERKKTEGSKQNEYAHSQSREKLAWMRASSKAGADCRSYEKPSGYIWKK